eukprot:CAMPEP_0181189208 /NCGR_PEP_ID=MMETSP1096-20121128/11540_1 /TAXON_ID=156174 ORGANISM="Chrysochromulina ericina, Strain CCMP281" /NCGR_SAMPLE_ID=MMETSP1096 /ASSEMBLY_ACC=CAM_ASM_000453 /LENGTH=164 /DNA_ID=CAMNT_0023278347 /DNA_START=33 /DNA_END=524 /DNA_ORIENTATION=-
MEDTGSNVSYLDNFLHGVTETNNVPAEMKRDLTRLRDLDTHSQEIFERMQKQSKNHIARAKRSVQSGAQLDDELLLKARKSFRELIELDEEKVACADQMCAYITKHLLHCETELQKFEEELKEKGQLKTPLLVKTESAASLAASLAAANAAVACGAASSTTAAA